jgi:copper chaperone CopZ
MVEPVYCVHCGAVAKHPVTKNIDGQLLNFCCGGCLQVYEMLHAEGLLPTAGASQAPAAPARQPAGAPLAPSMTLPIEGMSCANCVASVERSLRKVSGVLNVSVSLARGEATLELAPKAPTLETLKKAVQSAGYRVP